MNEYKYLPFNFFEVDGTQNFFEFLISRVVMQKRLISKQGCICLKK